MDAVVKKLGLCDNSLRSNFLASGTLGTLNEDLKMVPPHSRPSSILRIFDLCHQGPCLLKTRVTLGSHLTALCNPP